LMCALQHHPPPSIFHSDNGREYASKSFIDALDLTRTPYFRQVVEINSILSA